MSANGIESFELGCVKWPLTIGVYVSQISYVEVA